jgi:hypothetical protein
MLFREEDEDLEVLSFVDRAEAGRVLASKLSAYAGRDDVIVLGLPRGGVPVASTVAGVLHVPFDVFAVSKLGTPWNRELAMGAVAEGGVQVLDLSIVKERFVFTIPSRRLASARQETDFVSPVPIPSFTCQSGQGPDQTADVRGRNCFFVHKNHAAVRSLFFRPGFEQGRNRPPVISNKR